LRTIPSLTRNRQACTLSAALCAAYLIAAAPTSLLAQSAVVPATVSQVWAPDLGDGRYKNPILYADYSDADVIRVGQDFYLVASSFNMIPGLPILHSRDLVNWQIVAHALTRQEPAERFNQPNHGNGVWAPALRYHAGEFFLFYPEPDTGIYMTKASTVTGPWSTPILVKAGPGWIDPCPFWDDDGKAYLVNAMAASRSGIKSVIVLSRMSTDGTHLLDSGTIVVDGHSADPTLEGPKIYKRNGWYYLSAPAGGVPTGWQVVFRSRKIYGPYERRVVLAQGTTSINGPHQGAWVDTPSGESWFLHFQDQGPYGRVVLLEPMSWKDDWPIIGINTNASGTGEPVTTYHKPKVTPTVIPSTPADSDEFNAPDIGPQWQWQANPQPGWAFSSAALGVLRLTAIPPTKGDTNLWNIPNVLTQKLPGPAFTVTTKVTFLSTFVGEETGLVINGQSYAYIGIVHTSEGLAVHSFQRLHADGADVANDSPARPIKGNTVYLRATVQSDALLTLHGVHTGAIATFSYSENGTGFTTLGQPFHAEPGRWIGATVGLFALGTSNAGERGYADYDWFRFTPAPK